MISGDLKSKIDRLWDAFWSGGVSNPLEIIEQLTYLMYIRELDELQSAQEREAARAGQAIGNVVFAESDRRLRWSHFITEAPQNMLAIVRDEVFPWLRSHLPDAFGYPELMAGARLTIPTPSLLALLRMRNKIRHGAGPRTRAEFERSLEQIESLMLSSLSWCAFLARAKWVHMDRLHWLPDSGKYKISGLAFMGDHPDFEPISFENARPLVDDSLYMLTQQGEAIPLSPFCLLSDCPACLAPELYYPDRLTNSTAMLKSLDRGQELDSGSVFNSLRLWIAD